MHYSVQTSLNVGMRMQMHVVCILVRIGMQNRVIPGCVQYMQYVH